MANPLQQILASFAQRGQTPLMPFGGVPGGALDVNDERFQGSPIQWNQNGPERVIQGVSQHSARVPSPRQKPESVGGIFDDVFRPKTAGRNRTVAWLQQQGMDQGTAMVMASNKPALQSYLLDLHKGADPREALQAQKLELDILQKQRELERGGKPWYIGDDGKVDPAYLEAQKAGATKITNTVDMAQTKGRTEVDKKYAQDFVDWNARGAYADTLKQLGQLDAALTNLETGHNLTGPIVGSLPDAINSVINPQAIAVREWVEEVVQRNLRLVLGAQFTEKEGERLIARAYNPRLSEAENAQRVRRLIAQIRTAAEAKQAASEYFAKHGTLTGWAGKLPSLSDFDPEGRRGSDAQNGNRPSQLRQTESGVKWKVLD